MTELDIRHFLRAGDQVFVGQATAEPPRLVEALVAAAQEIADLSVVCGYSLTPAWNGTTETGPRIKAYAAHGALRKVEARGLIDPLPVHLHHVDRLIREDVLRPDVVLLQVGPLDQASGTYPLGLTVDYVSVAAERARVVLVEVNDNVPITRATRALPAERVTAAFPTSAALATDPARPANDVEFAVAANVARLVPDNATIQLGAGALANAIGAQLEERRGLRVRSGLAGDWLIGLHDAGALDPTPGSSATGMVLGGPALYDLLGRTDLVELRPHAELLAPEALAACSRYISVNSAIEVSLDGSLGAEVVAGRYVGAVGGQGDFFRASRTAPAGAAILALASTHPNGDSRIVASLSGPVTSTKSDVDYVVTEWGIADLRGKTLSERRRDLIAVAHPDHRAGLGAELAEVLS
ncbi:MAG: acetyl-CoA hydrolase/transferase C-terminal domain-containing protein [Tetrasphaera sp.]